MDQIHSAMNNLYKDATFSQEQQLKTFQKINEKNTRKSFMPLILTILITGCLLFGLKTMLEQHDNVIQSASAVIYPEKSGVVKDYTALQRPWMVVGLISSIVLFIYALWAIKKKWYWRLLLCIIIIIAILGNMSERIGDRVYVQNEAEIQQAIHWGPFQPNTMTMHDTLTIPPYRIGYFSRDNIKGISIFKHDGKGYALEYNIQSELDYMNILYFRENHFIVIPLLANHHIEKLVINTGSKRMEIAIDSNGAQLVPVELEATVTPSQLIIDAFDHDGNQFSPYKSSDIFSY